MAREQQDREDEAWGVPAALRAERGEMTITTDPRALDLAAIHEYLSRSYWAAGIPFDLVERSVRHSLCFGLFDGQRRQVGFARVVTDYATFAYLCDVYVLEEHRGRGLGRWLVEVVTSHPALSAMRRVLLATRDAHGFYAQCGFQPLPRPQNFLQIHRPDVYRST